MNSEPVTGTAPKTRVNNDFWEQCLTENQGQMEQHEVQLERRDVEAIYPNRWTTKDMQPDKVVSGLDRAEPVNRGALFKNKNLIIVV